MESYIFSDIIAILKAEFMKRGESIFSYLKDLSDIKRFRTLVMFMSNQEKQGMHGGLFIAISIMLKTYYYLEY